MPCASTYVWRCARAGYSTCAHAQHNSVDAEILYLAASWIREEYKFILIVLIKRKYPFSQLEGNEHITAQYADAERAGDEVGEWKCRDLWNMNVSSHYELDHLEKLLLSFH